MRLFEFGDQPWLPKVLHEGEVPYLKAAYRVVPLARAWADRIVAVLQPRGHIEILDLCSGRAVRWNKWSTNFAGMGWKFR